MPVKELVKAENAKREDTLRNRLQKRASVEKELTVQPFSNISSKASKIRTDRNGRGGERRDDRNRPQGRHRVPSINNNFFFLLFLFYKFSIVFYKYFLNLALLFRSLCSKL